jgi:hypothetical protein
MRNKKIGGCVIFTNTQKECYDWLIAQSTVDSVIQIEKNGDWARVILHEEEEVIPNPMGWRKEDFYE